MKRISALTRRVALGLLPMFALIALVPAQRAHAQFSSIVSGLTSTITGIGSLITSINSAISTMESLQRTVVYPINDLTNIEKNGLSIVNSYRNWMSTVFSIKLNSAQTTSGQALEQQLLSGAINSSPHLQLALPFTNTYGALPTTNQSSPTVRQAVDMGDASAQDAMQLSVMADASATSSIQVANTLESQALATSSGSAPQIEATALAYEIASMAVEHKILASELRSAASHLAYEGSGLKRGATVTGNGVQTVFGGVK